MGVFRTAATLLFILSIPVALVTANIRFMANEPRVYQYAIDEFDAVATTGIERDELIRAGRDRVRAFPWQRTTDGVIALYRACVAAR